MENAIIITTKQKVLNVMETIHGRCKGIIEPTKPKKNPNWRRNLQKPGTQTPKRPCYSLRPRVEKKNERTNMQARCTWEKRTRKRQCRHLTASTPQHPHSQSQSAFSYSLHSQSLHYSSTTRSAAVWESQPSQRSGYSKSSSKPQQPCQAYYADV